MNNVVLIGRLVRDPELRYIPSSGMAVANFTLAVDRGLSRDKKQEMEAKGQPTADFIRITVWGKQAENCANYLRQGLQTAIQGRIQTGSYTDNQGNRVYTTDVVANSVEFLEWPDNNTGGMGQAGGMTQQQRPQQNQPKNDDFGGIEGFQPADNDDIPF